MSSANTPYNLFDLAVLSSYQILGVHDVPVFANRSYYYDTTKCPLYYADSKVADWNPSVVTSMDMFLDYGFQANAATARNLLVPLNEEQRDKISKLFKYQIMHDLLVSGIPASGFKKTITLNFRQKNYHFNIEDVAVLDLARFPSKDHQFRNDFLAVHSLELASRASLIPAVDDQGNPVLFSAQNRAGTDLLQAFIHGVQEYRTTLNHILTMIQNTHLASDINKGTLPSTLWQSIYQTNYSIASVERVSLK